MSKFKKTNPMRLLEQDDIPYTPHEFNVDDGALDGVTAAERLGKPVEEVFKTLVTEGEQDHYVFIIPVAENLDLKAAAVAVDEKKIHMIPQKELKPLTGYIHGGCSPLGMRSSFPTVIDASAKELEQMTVSAGSIGVQMTLKPADLAGAIESFHGFYDVTQK